MTDTNAQGLSDEWIAWLRDVVVAADRFITEDTVHVSSTAEKELVAIKAALYARALTIFAGSLLLIENDRQLDFRAHSRGVIEVAMYLIALDRDPSFVQKMKDDDYKSRQSRAALHLNAKNGKAEAATIEMLKDFVALGSQGTKPIKVAALLDGSNFDRLYRSYRDISGDSAHVSVTALDRHYVENLTDGTAMLLVHPELHEADLYVTVTELGISMIISTLILMKIKSKTESWDEFQLILERYRTLSEGGAAEINQSA